MLSQESDSYFTGSLEFIPANPRSFFLATSAAFSILVSEPTTYGQWLHVKKITAPFSPITSCSESVPSPEFLFAFGSSKPGAFEPGSTIC